MILYTILFLGLHYPINVLSTFYYRASNELMWCVLSDEELNKCEEFARSTEKDQMDTNEEAFGSYYRKVFQISA